MNKKVWLFLVLVSGLVYPIGSPAFEFATYYPLQMGSVWTYQGVINPENAFVDSVCCLNEIEGQPEPAVLHGAEGGLQYICWSDGATVTWYGAIYGGEVIDFEPDAVQGSVADGAKFALCPDYCDSVMARVWDELDPGFVDIYDIDPSYGDLVVWAWYDSDEEPNSQNVIIESNLPADVNPPPGAVTDLEWFQVGVGRTVYIEVDASTGELGEKYVLISHVVGVDDRVVGQRVIQLHQNIPNPFNPVTSISFDLPILQHVKLAIFALDGRRVTTLLDEPVLAGHHEVTWIGRDDFGHDVASGSYIYRIEAGEYTATKRMVLIR